MAADYYPTTATSDYSNNVMAFSQNYAFNAFHPPAPPLSTQMPPLLLQSPPIQTTFQHPFLYVRPPFVDGLPPSQLHHYPQSFNRRSAEVHRSSAPTNRQSSYHRNHPKSANPPTQNMDSPETSSGSKSKRKKKKPKQPNAQDLASSFAQASLDDTIQAEGATAKVSSNSYSDVLKRPPVQPADNGTRELISNEVETSLEGKMEQHGKGKVLPTHFQQQPQQQRGVLHIPTSTNNHLAKNSFKLDLCMLASSASSPQNKKQKKSSSSKVIRPNSPERITSKETSSVKKGNSSNAEASLSSVGDSPERKPKYSKLKKVILEERKKRQQSVADVEDTEVSSIAEPDSSTMSDTCNIDAGDGALFVQLDVNSCTQHSSVASPAKSSYSPGTVCNAYLSTALSDLSKEDADAISRRLHRRRFREYCDQALGAALDDATYLLLTTLGGFQQRQYEQNPSKAKLRRRYVCGLREAIKHIQLGKARCIILAPNIERIPGKGGLDDIIGSIISQCANKNIPVVFALGRVALGRACSKPSPVSSVAIISPAGAEDKFKHTLELAERAHEDYTELVKMAVAEQLEQREQNVKNGSQQDKAFPAQSTTFLGQFASSRHGHMGHSRNASNISAISFISNISAVSDNSIGISNATADDRQANNIVTYNGESDKELDDVEDENDYQEEEDEPDDESGEESLNLAGKT